jgi:hypothetical protein
LKYDSGFNGYALQIHIFRTEKDLTLNFKAKTPRKSTWERAQNRALAVEARRLGIPVFIESKPVGRFHGRTSVT